MNPLLSALNRVQGRAAQLQRPAGGADGVLLFSGGMDSVLLGILARRQGLGLVPVFMSHRGNVGNVTKKELGAAHGLAEAVTGRPLVVFKPEAKSRPAAWYGDDVRFTDRLPVLKADKPQRNRTFLSVLHDAGLADGTVVVGVFGPGERAQAAGRADDVSKRGLQAHMRKIGARGTVLTAEDFGGGGRDSGKVDLLRQVRPRSKDAELVTQSESCLMYFAKPCGDCWSCMDRAEALLEAWGYDPTPYRSNSKAGRLTRRRKRP